MWGGHAANLDMGRGLGLTSGMGKYMKEKAEKRKGREEEVR